MAIIRLRPDPEHRRQQVPDQDLGQDAGDAVVYDNQMDAPDDADATDGDLAGGQPDSFDITIWQGIDAEADPYHRAKNDLAGGSVVVHRR